MIDTSYLIPKEHGSWAMWIVPFVIGVAAAARMTVHVPLLFGAVLLVFFARTAFANAVRLERRDAGLSRWLRQAGILELLTAALLGAPAAWWVGLPLIAVAVAAGAILAADLRWVRDRTERTVSAELLGVMGFSASALAGYAAASGRIGPEAWALWGISVAYFSGSIFYVKMRLERKCFPDRWFGPKARATLLYTVIATAFVLGLASAGWIRGWVALALSPWLVHVLADVFWPRPLGSIQRLGWTLVAHSVGFTLLSILFLQF